MESFAHHNIFNNLKKNDISLHPEKWCGFQNCQNGRQIHGLTLSPVKPIPSVTRVLQYPQPEKLFP